MYAVSWVRIVGLIVLGVVLSIPTAWAAPTPLTPMLVPQPSNPPQQPAPASKAKDEEVPPPQRTTPNPNDVTSNQMGVMVAECDQEKRDGKSIPPPEANDTTFVQDNDCEGSLDKFLHRNEAPNGKITFSINSRPYHHL